MFLIDRSDPRGFRQYDFAAERDQVAEDQPKQRRFADPIAPGQADFRPAWYGDIRRIEETAAPSIKNEILNAKHGVGVQCRWETAKARFLPRYACDSERIRSKRGRHCEPQSDGHSQRLLASARK
jgi:hypothetical protein